MGQENQDRDDEDGRLYRLEVRGQLPRNRRSWFGAEKTALHGPNTVLLLRVADQSDLYGRLRKIHDLNLQLISVQEMDGESGPEGDTGHQSEEKSSP